MDYNIQNILNSVFESKIKYIEVLNQNNETIFKIKLIMDESKTIMLLDKFFDYGYKVKKITKEEFDGFEGLETFNINL